MEKSQKSKNRFFIPIKYSTFVTRLVKKLHEVHGKYKTDKLPQIPINQHINAD
jgi:hypothetical protein